jgi:hypothetical protein
MRLNARARSADPGNEEPAATRSSKRASQRQRIDVSHEIDRPRRRALRSDHRGHLNRKGSYREEICVAQNRDHRCRHGGGRRWHCDRCACTRWRRQWRPSRWRVGRRSFWGDGRRSLGGAMSGGHFGGRAEQQRYGNYRGWGAPYGYYGDSDACWLPEQVGYSC